MCFLPTRKLLANAVIQVLKQVSEPMRACDINDKVAEPLQIPQDVLEIEDTNCTGTEFSYQMRWIRTESVTINWTDFLRAYTMNLSKERLTIKSQV